MLMHPPRALYIHIPFCKHRCHYCDFNTYVLAGQPVDAYLDALEREMERTVLALPPERIDTVFVGGGTPTVLTPEQMAHFLGAVRRWFPVAPDAEFSVEANPGTTGPELLAAMREGGVNRISFGVQAFDDALLQRIGRIHDTNDVYRSIELAREAGFNNLSIDLMFGLPGQTMELLADSVRRAVELDLPHYSLYGLKIEENTLFHVLYERNELPLPAEEEELQMYLFIMERLEAAGRSRFLHLDASVLTVMPALVLGTTAAIGARRSPHRGSGTRCAISTATVFDFMGATLTMLHKRPPAPDDTGHSVRLAWGVPVPGVRTGVRGALRAPPGGGLRLHRCRRSHLPAARQTYRRRARPRHSPVRHRGP